MKRSIFTFVMLALLVFACKKKEENKAVTENKENQTQKNNTEQREEANPTLISCEGIGKVRFSMSYADLEKTFGKESLKSDTILAGTRMMGEEVATEDLITTTVEAPEGKIYLTWVAGKNPQKIEKMSIVVHDKPQYKFANGISVGSSFKDFCEANENGVFEFHGFGWQYGGLIITETAQGKFFKENPCFSGGFFSVIGDNYDLVRDLMGDSKFKSNATKEKSTKNIILSGITISNK
jgi:hypothetical protein